MDSQYNRTIYALRLGTGKKDNPLTPDERQKVTEALIVQAEIAIDAGVSFPCCRALDRVDELADSPNLKANQRWLMDLLLGSFIALELHEKAATVLGPNDHKEPLPDEPRTLDDLVTTWIWGFLKAIDKVDGARDMVGATLGLNLRSISNRIVLRACFDLSLEHLFVTHQARPFIHPSGLHATGDWEGQRNKCNIVANLAFDGLSTLLIAWSRFTLTYQQVEVYGTFVADLVRNGTLGRVSGGVRALQSAIRTALWIARPPFVPIRASNVLRFASDTVSQELITDREDEVWQVVIGKKPE